MGDHNNHGHVPYDICFEILSRLPVKSLFRFMSVSKQWLSIISSDPQFIQKHLFHAQKNPNLRHIISTRQLKVLLDRRENLISLAVANSPSSNNEKPEILASCNGLLLLGIGETNHFLWNPSTRSYKKVLGNLYHYRDKNNIRMYGLGYDSSSNAYKVIRIVRVISSALSARYTHDPYRHWVYDATQVRVYNSRTNSWRRVEEFPYKIFINQPGLLVNGFPHWIVARAEIKEYVIIYFDLAEEKFKELENPSWLVFDSAFCLGVTKGLISVLRKAEVWVMKESWTKLTNANIELRDFKIEIRPIKKIIEYPVSVFEAAEYVESLISPHITSEVNSLI